MNNNPMTNNPYGVFSPTVDEDGNPDISINLNIFFAVIKRNYNDAKQKYQKVCTELKELAGKKGRKNRQRAIYFELKKKEIEDYLEFFKFVERVNVAPLAVH